VKTVNIGTQDEEVLSEAQRLGLAPELSVVQIPGIDVRPLGAITGHFLFSFLCVDEKSQLQALNRTQPILPLARGVPARQSHDYERHGVTSLFAALDVASGVNISSCYRRHRHQEFLRCLNEIDANTPRFGRSTAEGQLWHTQGEQGANLAGAPSSLLRSIHTHQWELAEPGGAIVCRGYRAMCSAWQPTGVARLEKAILGYLEKRNRNPKLFVWTADADLILGKVERLCKPISDSGR
jgi:hypothetical protein